jgi:hypothetical protein
MIRASSAYKICTHRPEIDNNSVILAERILKEKIKDKKLGPYNKDKLDTYCETHGITTVAKAYKKALEQRELALIDDLPPGTKNYLKEVWLENNIGYVDFSTSEGFFGYIATQNGILSEEGAIKILNRKEGTNYKKNTKRITKGFVTGECDIRYNKVETDFLHNKIDIVGIRDVKVPKDWKSFKSKNKIPSQYYWQLVVYCYLYQATEAYVDFIQMPLHDLLIDEYTRYFDDIQLDKFEIMQRSINDLSVDKRVKSFRLQTPSLEEDIKFFLSRLGKSELYYNQLTYEECMGLNYF